MLQSLSKVLGPDWVPSTKKRPSQRSASPRSAEGKESRKRLTRISQAPQREAACDRRSVPVQPGYTTTAVSKADNCFTKVTFTFRQSQLDWRQSSRNSRARKISTSVNLSLQIDSRSDQCVATFATFYGQPGRCKATVATVSRRPECVSVSVSISVSVSVSVCQSVLVCQVSACQRQCEQATLLRQ